MYGSDNRTLGKRLLILLTVQALPKIEELQPLHKNEDTCIDMSTNALFEVNEIIEEIVTYLGDLSEKHNLYDLTLVRINIDKHLEIEPSNKNTTCEIFIDDCDKNDNLITYDELKTLKRKRKDTRSLNGNNNEETRFYRGENKNVEYRSKFVEKNKDFNYMDAVIENLKSFFTYDKSNYNKKGDVPIRYINNPLNTNINRNPNNVNEAKSPIASYARKDENKFNDNAASGVFDYFKSYFTQNDASQKPITYANNKNVLPNNGNSHNQPIIDKIAQNDDQNKASKNSDKTITNNKQQNYNILDSMAQSYLDSLFNQNKEAKINRNIDLDNTSVFRQNDNQKSVKIGDSNNKNVLFQDNNVKNEGLNLGGFMENIYKSFISDILKDDYTQNKETIQKQKETIETEKNVKTSTDNIKETKDYTEKVELITEKYDNNENAKDNNYGRDDLLKTFSQFFITDNKNTKPIRTIENNVKSINNKELNSKAGSNIDTIKSNEYATTQTNIVKGNASVDIKEVKTNSNAKRNDIKVNDGNSQNTNYKKNDEKDTKQKETIVINEKSSENNLNIKKDNKQANITVEDKKQNIVAITKESTEKVTSGNENKMNNDNVKQQGQIVKDKGTIINSESSSDTKQNIGIVKDNTKSTLIKEQVYKVKGQNVQIEKYEDVKINDSKTTERAIIVSEEKYYNQQKDETKVQIDKNNDNINTQSQSTQSDLIEKDVNKKIEDTKDKSYSKEDQIIFVENNNKNDNDKDLNIKPIIDNNDVTSYKTKDTTKPIKNTYYNKNNQTTKEISNVAVTEKVFIENYTTNIDSKPIDNVKRADEKSDINKFEEKTDRKLDQNKILKTVDSTVKYDVTTQNTKTVKEKDDDLITASTENTNIVKEKNNYNVTDKSQSMFVKSGTEKIENNVKIEKKEAIESTLQTSSENNNLNTETNPEKSITNSEINKINNIQSISEIKDDKMTKSKNDKEITEIKNTLVSEEHEKDEESEDTISDINTKTEEKVEIYATENVTEKTSDIVDSVIVVDAEKQTENTKEGKPTDDIIENCREITHTAQKPANLANNKNEFKHNKNNNLKLKNNDKQETKINMEEGFTTINRENFLIKPIINNKPIVFDYYEHKPNRYSYNEIQFLNALKKVIRDEVKITFEEINDNIGIGYEKHTDDKLLIDENDKNDGLDDGAIVIYSDDQKTDEESDAKNELGKSGKVVIFQMKEVTKE